MIIRDAKQRLISLQFSCLEDDSNLIVPISIALPDSYDYDYIRNLQLSNEKARLCLEASVKHYLHNYAKYFGNWFGSRRKHASQRTLLPRIPKKRPPRLVPRTETEGYGMQAIARLAVYKIVIMFVAWQSGSIVFLIYWLYTHKGDLQNAFVPITTTMAGFVIYLAILDRFVRR